MSLSVYVSTTDDISKMYGRMIVRAIEEAGYSCTRAPGAAPPDTETMTALIEASDVFVCILGIGGPVTQGAETPHSEGGLSEGPRVQKEEAIASRTQIHMIRFVYGTRDDVAAADPPIAEMRREWKQKELAIYFSDGQYLFSKLLEHLRAMTP